MARATTDKALLQQRNREIVDKFNHYYNVKRLRYDDVLYKLKWEHFFLSERFMHRILRQQKTSAPKVHVKNSKTLDDKTVFEHRNEKVRARFSELHDIKRLRIDDAAEALKKEFFITTETLSKILAEYEKYKPAKPLQTSLNFD